MRPEVYDVMFATASTASLKKTNDVVIMLKNQERALHVNAVGKVTATDISLAQFFTMESVGDILSETFKIALYAKEVGRYLCFRRGKLVGMKSLTRDCHFIESLEHGYFLYANAYNPLWRVGFTRGLKPVGPRHLKKPQSLRRACFLFVKINAEHFDRDMFTTTTSTTPRSVATTVKAKPSMEVARRRHDSKASIIDSNVNKTRKSGRHHDAESINSSNGRQRGADSRWQEGRDFIRQQHRKRKHQTKHSTASGGGKPPQPKNLLRMRHEEGHGKERRRQHEREKKIRRMRLQNQRTRKQSEQSDRGTESIPNATNSATPSVAATTLAATASLAPSALNIVAMLAAGRRKKGRRKKQAEASDSSLSSTSDSQQTVDIQLVAQSPLQAQSQYDLVDPEIQPNRPMHRLRHEHNYHQQHEPVTAANNNVHQQNHKYSNNNNDNDNNNNNRDSHLYSNNLKPSLSFNLKDNVNAKPALPKKYLSKNNHNNEYFIHNTRSPTDFNTKVDNFSHSPKTTPYPYPYPHPYPHPNPTMQQISNDNFDKKESLHLQQQKQQKHSNIRSNNSHTSHTFYKIPLTNFKRKSDKIEVSDSDENADDDDDDDDDDNYDHINDYNNNNNNTYTNTNNNNSNRLLDNNSNIRDNNFQQEHLVNRFKPIYLDRISHSFNSNSNNKLNNTKQQHYNINTPISSSSSSSSRSSTNTASTVNVTVNDSKEITNYSQAAFNTKGNGGSSGRHSGTTTTNISHSHSRSRRNIINIYNNKINNNNYNNNYNVNKNISYVLANNNDNVNISNNPLNSIMATAYRNMNFIGQRQQQQPLEQQQQQIINKNPTKIYNYNDDEEDVENDNDEKFKRIQNKYKTIIVQYRSVVYLLIIETKKKHQQYQGKYDFAKA